MISICANRIRARVRFDWISRMTEHIGVAISAISILGLLWVGPLRAETSSQSKRAQIIASLIWQSQFGPALDSCHDLVNEEPRNPLGYCLLGMTYFYIGSQYRTDRYADLITDNLDTAIALAGARVGSGSEKSERLFLLGSAFGYRALERSIHGAWWGAQRDGHHSCISLEKAYDLDTTLTDAFLGIGNYHYWKSAKSKFITWLPFVSDNRQLGISEIKRVTRFGLVGTFGARVSLLPIYLNERRYLEVISIGGLFVF